MLGSQGSERAKSNEKSPRLPFVRCVRKNWFDLRNDRSRVKKTPGKLKLRDSGDKKRGSDDATFSP